MSDLPLIVFDVNETLLDLETMAPTFERIFDDKAAMRLAARNRAKLEATAQAVKAASAEALVIDLDLAEPSAARNVVDRSARQADPRLRAARQERPRLSTADDDRVESVTHGTPSRSPRIAC